jgi:hypothetical protein
MATRVTRSNAPFLKIYLIDGSDEENELPPGCDIYEGDQICWCQDQINKNDTAYVRRDDVINLLKEIAKGEGRFDTDRLKHASNTIEHMKQLALKGIEKFK